MLFSSGGMQLSSGGTSSAVAMAGGGVTSASIASCSWSLLRQNAKVQLSPLSESIYVG